MPTFTPSRIAIVLLCFSLGTFLWTYGFPQQLGQPTQPVIDHYDHKNVHSAPIIPTPVITTHATAPAPTATVPAEYEADGGRWDDTDKQKEGEKEPTTLLTMASPTANASSTPTPQSGTKFCKEIHGAPNVLIVLRTSKAEIARKLPTHLQTLLECVPHFAIFSDHSGELDGVPVYDALDSITNDTQHAHAEFDEYQLMRVDSEHAADPGKTKTLDKWKFLPMVYKAHRLRPEARFYLFLEADTSLSWTNLLQWTNRLDYRIPYYSGAPTFVSQVKFAQRGPGILISQGAMRRYANFYDDLYTSKWEAKVGKECCGDLVLAQAMADAHVEFYSSWPLLQGDHPASLDYSQRHWCAPAVSWHHTSPDTITDIWSTQKKWTAKHGWDKPYLFRDAFEDFVTSHMETQKDKWDNLSQDAKIAAPQGRQQQIKDEAERSKQDEEFKKSSPPPLRRKDDKKKEIDWDKLAEQHKDAGDSADRCQKTCEAIENCLQWLYTSKADGECHLSKVLRLGQRTNDNGDGFVSGWLMERIEKVKKEWECKKVKWEFYQ